MSVTEGPTKPKSGISRRDLIKKGAVAGAVIWTVPMIESVPAYAATGSTLSTTCSYFVLVYTINGAGPYADRVGSSGACGGNTTSHDVQWCWIGPGSTDIYDNLGANDAIRRNGTVLDSSKCTAASGTFHVSGNTVTPGTGVVIQFAVAHAGSLNTTTGQEPGTPTGTPVGSACNVLASQSKVNVACAPISLATFSCLA